MKLGSLDTTNQPNTPPSLAGALLSLEGIDGSGKTTQSRILAKRLRNAGFDVLETCEPGGTPIAKGIRDLLELGEHPLNEARHPQTELLLFLAARKQHIHHRLMPALQNGQVVICDRFHDSTIAYQGYGLGIDVQPLQGWIEKEIHALCIPHLTFWLDVSAETAATRRHAREKAEIAAAASIPAAAPTQNTRPASFRDGENAVFFQRVCQGYAALHQREPQRIVRIDANGTTQKIETAIWQALETRFCPPPT